MKRIHSRVPPSSPDDAVAAKYLTFWLDKQYYGMSIRNVIEIVQLQPITALPEAPIYIKGVICMRGRVIPLVDLHLRFGNQQRAYTDRTCIIIVDLDGFYVGMIVDQVEDVLDIDSGLISTPLPVSADPLAHCVAGIAKLDGQVALLLNIRALFSAADLNLLTQTAG